MHIILASALLAMAAMPAHADVSETPIPDGPPMSIEEILADIPAADPGAPQAPLPAGIVPVQATSGTAIPAADAAPQAAPDPAVPTEPQQVTDSNATPADPAPADGTTTADTPHAAPESVTTTVPVEGGEAVAETPAPAPAEATATAASAEAMGYTQPVPTPSGAMPESTTWQPPVATGIDLTGNPRS